MSTEPAAYPFADAQLRVQAAGADRLLSAGSSYRIGRDPGSDIVVADPRVSWRHATIEMRDGGWLLEDTGSSNGTFVNGQRVRQVAIAGNCRIRLGHPEDGPSLTCSVASSNRSSKVSASAGVSTGTGSGFLNLHSPLGHCATGPALGNFSIR